MRTLILILAAMLLISTSAFAVEGRVYAQRVTVNGATLGSPIPLNSGTTGQPQSQPRVSFYNDRFLVVYQEWNGSDLDVKAVRMSTDGTVLDTTPISIAAGVKTQALPDVAADTTGWMVVWQSFPAGSHFPSLYAKRVNYDGSLGGTTLQFGDSATIGSYPRIAYNATEDTFGVLYTGSNHDRVTYHKASVTVLTTTPGLSSAGTDFVGSEQQAPFHYAITADPSAGWVMTVSGKAAQPLNTKPGQAAIAIGTDGNYSAGNYMNGSENVTSQWLAGWGDLMDAQSGSITEIAYGFSAVAMDSTYAIAAWENWDMPTNLSYRANLASIRVGRLNGYDLVETVGGTEVLTRGSGVSYEKPALASNGSGKVLLTYDKTTNGAMELGSKRLTIGSPITTEDEVILRDTTNGSRRSQSHVAYGDNKFMVVWTEGWWGTL